VVSVRERERLIARIRQLRRVTEAGRGVQTTPVDPAEPDEVRALQNRVEHLEALVQGLQDSVHRESSRQAKRIAELEARLNPAALGKALSDDARARGL
jgi:hypothetical protein